MATFWKSFWRETGKNTGKWTSNKVFGNKGWATPKRHILDTDEVNNKSTSSKRKSRSSSSTSSSRRSLSSDSTSSNEETEATYNGFELVDKINESDFGDSADSICEALDDLFPLLADTGYAYDGSIKEKIRSGIFHLRRKGAHYEAEYYEKRLKKKSSGKVIFILLLVGFLAVGFGLIFSGVLD